MKTIYLTPRHFEYRQPLPVFLFFAFLDGGSPICLLANTEKEGEFHVDLYTLPDALIKMLWDFTQEKGVV